MNEELEHNIPSDADDLSKYAPTLFAMKSKDDGFVAPANYFEELTDLVMAKTVIPSDGGLTIDENYFDELPEIIVAKTSIPTESGLDEPKNYFEELGTQLESRIALEGALPKNSQDVPEGYFDAMESELLVHIALDNIKQEEGFVVPEGYFENLTARTISTAIVAFDSAQLDNMPDPNIPAGYFDSLYENIVDRLESEGAITPQRGRIVVFAAYVKQYARPIAIAASAALLIGLGWFAATSGEDSPKQNTVAQVDSVAPRMKNAMPIVGDSLRKEEIPVGIANESPKNNERIKPIAIPEVIMNNDEIIAQSDLLDEAMVMDFVAENEVVNANEEVLDQSMMDYLMNDDSNLDVFDPGKK